jgi:hypothetical protein
MVHYKKNNITTFDVTIEEVFNYMKEGNHKHQAFKSHQLINSKDDQVIVEAEIYNPDGSTFKTRITHKFNLPKGIETTMEGGAFSGAKFTHSYTAMGNKTRVDLEGDFPAFPGMPEADELAMIDGFFTKVFAEDTATLKERSLKLTY